MLVIPKYPGDNDTELMWVQHDCYGAVISYWVDQAKSRWFESENLLGVRTVFGDRLRNAVSFDHRSVQNAHDYMAASFRRDVFGLRQFGLFDKNQMKLKERMEYEWWEWLRPEVARLCNETTLTRLLLEAVTRSREPLGAGANEALATAMAARYGMMRPEQ